MADKGLIQIRFEQEEVNKIRDNFFGIPRAMPRLMSRAINRTGREGKTQIARWVSRTAGLHGFDVESGITLTKATLNHWEAQLRISGVPIPLIFFSDQLIDNISATKTKEAFGRRRLVGKAFKATMPSGHTGIFKRIDRRDVNKWPEWYKQHPNLPISELRGPSLGELSETFPEVLAAILERHIIIQIGLKLDERRVG